MVATRVQTPRQTWNAHHPTHRKKNSSPTQLASRNRRSAQLQLHRKANPDRSRIRSIQTLGPSLTLTTGMAYGAGGILPFTNIHVGPRNYNRFLTALNAVGPALPYVFPALGGAAAAFAARLTAGRAAAVKRARSLQFTSTARRLAAARRLNIHRNPHRYRRLGARFQGRRFQPRTRYNRSYGGRFNRRYRRFRRW